jgi:hypothetical protein
MRSAVAASAAAVVVVAQFRVARGAACAAPLVTLKMGRDAGTCSDLGTHGVPLYEDASACHGWVTEDPTYHDSRDLWFVEQSATNIRCLDKGGLELTLFSHSINCTGPSVVRRFYEDQCVPEGEWFTAAADLACCRDPAACAVGVPFPSVAWGAVFLDGERCESDKPAPESPPSVPTEEPQEPDVPLPVVIIEEPPLIPSNCVRWFDGCNSCGVKDGQLLACTLMYCSEPGEPKCLESAAMEPPIAQRPPIDPIVEEPPVFTIEPWLTTPPISTELPTGTEMPTLIVTKPCTHPPSDVTLPTSPPSLSLDPTVEAAERAREEQAGARAELMAGIAIAVAVVAVAALVLVSLCLYWKLRRASNPESSPATACKVDLEAHAVHPNTELAQATELVRV